MAGTQLGAQPVPVQTWESSACRAHTQLSIHTYTSNVYIDMPHIHTDGEMARSLPASWAEGVQAQGFLSSIGQNSYLGTRAQGGSIWGQWKGWALSVALLPLDTLTVPACPKGPQWF